MDTDWERRGMRHFGIGQAVVTTKGSLADAQGRIAQHLEGARTLVRLVGYGEGVYLILPTAWLTVIDEDSGAE